MRQPFPGARRTPVFLLLLIGFLVAGAGGMARAAVSKVDVSVAVSEPTAGLVQKVVAEFRHDLVTIPGNLVNLQRQGDRFEGSLQVPAGLPGELSCTLRVHTTETDPHRPIVLLARRIPVDQPQVGPTVRIERNLTFMRLDIEALEEANHGGVITRTPVDPDLTISAPRPGGGSEYTLVQMPRGRFSSGRATIHVPVDAFALPSGSRIRLFGMARGRTVSGGFRSQATAYVSLQSGATRLVELVFLDWLREIREAVRPVL
ncbi:MAG: hypothetical protein V2A76_10675, partial [Planctomycetota bacterium]